ncbi:flippase [Furfurilactobacillus milii]|uniref:Oligosaccharide flippase family protein n=1 Tax=Furfurilactobacillus milii TaxID=2888272 RepID=A0A6N9I053_9LACO|nr:flippase [Furfurilactobacillus milii]MYV16371.1 oligosaccharide flippase family protein [Furfurilactobacillus milii]
MRTIRNLLYNASYQVLLLLIPLITQPYVSRVLQPYGNGVYNYTYSIIQYFVLIGDLGITLYGNREIAYHKDDKQARSRIFWEIEILQLITTTSALLVFFAFTAFDRQYLTIQLLQILWLIASGIDISWYFMGLEDFGKTVFRNTLVKVVCVILIFIFVKKPSDLAIYTIIQGASQLLGGLTLWPYLRHSVERVSLKSLQVWKHFKPSLVLFLPNIAVQIYAVVNRTMLTQFDSVKATSYFTFADNIVHTVLAVVTATGTVMLPHVAAKFAKGDIKGVHNSLYRNMNFVTSISVPLMFGLMAVGGKFAPWFFGSRYVASGPVIVTEAPIILLIAWSTVTGKQYLMPVQRMKDLTTSVSLGAVVNIFLNIPLIIWAGPVGAAYAAVLSELVVTVYQIYIVRDSLDLRKMFFGQWKYFVSGLIMYLIVFAMVKRWSMDPIHIIVEVMAGAIIYTIGLMFTRAKIIDDVRSIIRTQINKRKG